MAKLSCQINQSLTVHTQTHASKPQNTLLLLSNLVHFPLEKKKNELQCNQLTNSSQFTKYLFSKNRNTSSKIYGFSVLLCQLSHFSQIAFLLTIISLAIKAGVLILGRKDKLGGCTTSQQQRNPCCSASKASMKQQERETPKEGQDAENKRCLCRNSQCFVWEKARLFFFLSFFCQHSYVSNKLF